MAKRKPMSDAERIAAYRTRKRVKRICTGSGCWNRARSGRTECQDCQDENTRQKRNSRRKVN